MQVWNAEAEHLAESVAKGDEVIVTGQLQVRCWNDREGGQRFQKRIRTLGPVGISTRRATAQITKAQRTNDQEVPLPKNQPSSSNHPLGRPPEPQRESTS